MRETLSQTSKIISRNLRDSRRPKITEHSQPEVIAANFTRRRSRKESLTKAPRWKRSPQAPGLFEKARATALPSVQLLSKPKNKAAKRKLNKCLTGEQAICPKALKKNPAVKLLTSPNASPLLQKLQPKRFGHERQFKQKHVKRKRKADSYDEDITSRIKKRVKYLLYRMSKEQNLIDAYSAEGWKGQSREKLKPERELQKAKAQILHFRLGIREAMQQLDFLGLEGSMKEYIFDSQGQIYYEDIFCAICKRQDVMVNNDIILCDGACDRAFHQLCLKPPLRTDEIPPDEEGWLCPVCDCKSECLDAVNAYFGTSYCVEDPWKKIFAEAASLGSKGGNQSPEIEDWPSEDSEDVDYVPGQEKSNSTLHTKGQEGSRHESVSLTTSSEQSESDSNTSDAADSKLSLLNELAEIMKTEFDVRDGRDAKEEIALLDDENVVLVDGKRQRKEVDYKQLHDEMFGKSMLLEEASEDEEWGPRKSSRKLKQSLQLFHNEAKMDHLKHGSAGTSGKTILTESSPTLQNKQRRVFLTPYAVQKLRAAFKENPLPSRACKEGLSKQLGLSFGKVHVWFKNVRCAALKKGLIQRAKGRGKSLSGSSSVRKTRHNYVSSKVNRDSERGHWLALMDMLSEAQLKLENLRSCLQDARVQVQDSCSPMYVAVAELKEKVRT